MSGANHVAGGIVFTGLFTSFWNINIFKNPWLLFFTILFSILPDIDHLKSPIGKLFYPIAKYLDRKFGHRTITHSLAFYLVLGVIVAFIESLFFHSNIVTIVYWFAYISHIIFDMMTVQGVPFFYPFKRNPCVIPGDAKLRLKVADVRSESIVFCIFLLLGITCKGLFLNGFWSTYNRAFGTVKHLHQERLQTGNILSVVFDYNQDGRQHKGKGVVIKTEKDQAIILTETSFLTITENDKIKKLEIGDTGKKPQIQESLFFNITPDSLSRMIKDKPILNLKLQSNTSFQYIKDNQPIVGKTANLEYVLNPLISFQADTSTNKISLRKRLDLLNYEIALKKKEYQNEKQKQEFLTYQIKEITTKLPSLSFYEREQHTEELKRLKLELSQIDLGKVNKGKLEIEKNHLIGELNKNKQVVISGFIKECNL